jgi:tetraprenyl-beta-curcumene synthase
VANRLGTRTQLAAGFAGAATRYWLDVFPRVCGEVAHWRRRAEEIPDPVLRELALVNLNTERLNLDGAAAFAAFVPEARRAAVVRSQVAFQAAYDYVDTLAEQSSDDPARNGQRLHEALCAALDPEAPQLDYYAHHPRNDDAGYLAELVEACRTALCALPSFHVVAASARRAAARIAAYQSLNLAEAHGGHAALERWALEHTPSESSLRWWETAASAGSSLAVFVHIAQAAECGVRVEDVSAIEAVYFPWVGSLHTLLDSLVDRRVDAAAGQRSLLDYYSSPQETAARMTLLASEAARLTRALPRGGQHAMVLAGMAGHYLSSPEASLPEARVTSRSVMRTMGELAIPVMLVMLARRAVARATDG